MEKLKGQQDDEMAHIAVGRLTMEKGGGGIYGRIFGGGRTVAMTGAKERTVEKGPLHHRLAGVQGVRSKK